MKEILEYININNVTKRFFQAIIAIILILSAINIYILILQTIKVEIIKKGWHVKVLNNYINIRELADENSEKIGQVKKGNVYKVLEINFDNNLYYFYKIQISDSKVGWIANDKKTNSFLKDNNNPNDIAYPTIKVMSKVYSVDTIEEISYDHLEVWDDKDDYSIKHVVYEETSLTENKYWIVYTITDKVGKSNSAIQEIVFLTKPIINQIKKISELSTNYYVPERLPRYLDFVDKNNNLMLDEVISIVNTNADYDAYTNVNDADLTKGNLIIVNKYHKLNPTYIPIDLVDIDLKYGTGKLQFDAYQNLVIMIDKAELDGIQMYVSSSYRSYDFQESLYRNYVSLEGQAFADLTVARAGHSEHQTGLALDLSSKNIDIPYFKNTNEFKWLKNNAHLYGFILRYPEGKEELTGYSYESWHYRYVGVDVATDIYNKGITFDEYYEFYIK